ncbi:MAG: histidine kinase dimerization/phospho-acceptor domain-containing protein [Mariprofundus sp.]|nr:histidine kinase dimerization/phospho-acceptor domain-containing protein [Mariprofundus sp.]
MYTTANQTLMMLIGIASVFLLTMQAVLSFSHISLFNQWCFQYGSDAILASLLVLASGGNSSPFALLLGLIVIASGVHAQRLLPLIISTFACATYLLAVYGELWLRHDTFLTSQQALHVLLQVSALILVGGVMAFIARRHASLSASSNQAVRQHRKLKDLHDRIMAEMGEGVILLDQQLHFIDMNMAANILLKRDSLATLLLFPPLADFFHQALQDSKANSFQCEYARDDQALLLATRRLWVEDHTIWLLTVVDVSEVKQLKEQLIQQEKMAALGQMAAMLAHEIRNPIQTMAYGLEIMGESPANTKQVQGILHDEMLRLNRLVSMMLQYSKPLYASESLTCMSDFIHASLQLFDKKDRQYIHLNTQVDEVCLDRDHFRLVLDNLLSNALANRPEEDSPVEITLSSDEKGWKLDVSNQGEIADTVREHLFEPFVSGRSAGIGLGLATVKHVCSVNDWTIIAHSDAGVVCFTVEGPLLATSPVETSMMEVKHG